MLQPNELGNLLLTRRVGETITIGKDIRVTVVAIEGANRIKLGVEAPKEVPIKRGARP